MCRFCSLAALHDSKAGIRASTIFTRRTLCEVTSSRQRPNLSYFSQILEGGPVLRLGHIVTVTGEMMSDPFLVSSLSPTLPKVFDGLEGVSVGGFTDDYFERHRPRAK